MPQGNGKIYQIARRSAGFTQEKAAELVDVSVESLRAYEGGERSPSTQVVLRMIDVYQYPVLAHQHLRYSNELAAELLPPIKDNISLSEAVLSLLCELREVDEVSDMLAEIAKDNTISPEQLQEFTSCMEHLQRIQSAITSLKYATAEEEKDPS